MRRRNNARRLIMSRARSQDEDTAAAVSRGKKEMSVTVTESEIKEGGGNVSDSVCVCVCDDEERGKRRRASLLCVVDDLVQPLEHMASEAGVIAIASRQFPLLFLLPCRTR